MIFIYLSGGASHVDSFDPKPKLAEYQREGKTGENNRKMLGSPWAAKPHGQSGIEVTDLFPNIAECVDDLCVVRSMRGDHNDHFQATLGIHTGSVTFKRPSVGSWVTYGLGTENQNLPCYVVLAPEMPYAGSQIWSSDFLPGVYSGTRITSGPEPVPDLNRRAPSPEMQKLELSLLDRFNRKHEKQHPGDPMLDARIKSYETAFGMQMTMPQVLDLSKETDATLKLYGMERGATTGFGWQCIVARRMMEQGVRFVELIDVGSSKNWDAHGDIHTHAPLAKNIDQPIAGSAGRPEIPRHVEGHAGGLHHGIRTLSRTGGRNRTRPLQSRVLQLAGRRRRQRRHHLRQDRRIRREDRGERMPRARFPRHDPALPGLRPHKTHISPCRPRLPADGRGRQRR